MGTSGFSGQFQARTSAFIRDWRQIDVRSRADQVLRGLNHFPCLEQYLLTATVIELRGPVVGVAGDSLSSFKGAVILQKICDAVARNE
jgi:hypothetical protein